MLTKKFDQMSSCCSTKLTGFWMEDISTGISSFEVEFLLGFGALDMVISLCDGFKAKLLVWFPGCFSAVATPSLIDLEVDCSESFCSGFFLQKLASCTFSKPLVMNCFLHFLQ